MNAGTSLKIGQEPERNWIRYIWTAPGNPEAEERTTTRTQKSSDSATLRTTLWKTTHSWVEESMCHRTSKDNNLTKLNAYVGIYMA